MVRVCISFGRTEVVEASCNLVHLMSCAWRLSVLCSPTYSTRHDIENQPSPVPHRPTLIGLSLNTSTFTSSEPLLPPRRSTTIQSPAAWAVIGTMSRSAVRIPIAVSLNVPSPETSKIVLFGPWPLSTESLSEGRDLKDVANLSFPCLATIP